MSAERKERLVLRFGADGRIDGMGVRKIGVTEAGTPVRLPNEVEVIETMEQAVACLHEDDRAALLAALGGAA